MVLYIEGIPGTDSECRVNHMFGVLGLESGIRTFVVSIEYSHTILASPCVPLHIVLSVPLHWIKDPSVHIYRVPTASVAPSVIVQHMRTEVSLLY